MIVLGIVLLLAFSFVFGLLALAPFILSGRISEQERRESELARHGQAGI